MNKLKQLRKQYDSVDCRDLGARKLEQLRNGLKNVTPDEVSSSDDGKAFIELLRKFRDNYLQKNPNTIAILEEYDFIGPVISKRIAMEENKDTVAQQLFLNYLVPVFDDIVSDNYAEAIKKYT